MTNTSKTIIFFGSGTVAASSLDFIAQHFNVEFVITKPRPAHHKHNAPVEELAKKLGLKILFASDKQQLDQIINSSSFVSQLGIIIDFGVIISKMAIDKFSLGIINSHFSLLPQWRGADPITFSILSGQKETGVSLMVIDEGMDTGKLLIQEKIEIESSETSISLTQKLVTKSNQMLMKFIPKYIDGEIESYDQPSRETATYSKKITKQDGIINNSKSSDELEQEIRAYQGWPGSTTTYENKVIKIKKAHTSATSETELDILCSDNRYLIIDELVAPSGKIMPAKAFLNGYCN